MNEVQLVTASFCCVKRGWARQVGMLSSVSVYNFATLVGCGRKVEVSNAKSCVYGQDACGVNRATVLHDVVYLLISTKYHSRRRRPLEIMHTHIFFCKL